MKKFFVLSSWSRIAAIGSMLIMAFAVIGCDDDDSWSPSDADNSRSSSVIPGSDPESSSIEKANSSSSDARQAGSSSAVIASSSSTIRNDNSSLSETTQSSSSITTATPCNVDGVNNCVYGSLTDSRDGKTYKTVKIGDQVWMAENLNYAYTGVPYKYGSLRYGSFTSDSTSWCYKNDSENCAKYGRLYTWAAAMDSVGKWSTNGKGCGYDTTCSPTYPVRGICPEGWHLPDITEWNALFTAVGGRSTAGMVLKSTSGWYNSSNGSDAFGFLALSAGFGGYSGLFSNEGYSASFWSSTEGSIRYAYDMYLYHSDDGADLGDSDKNKVFSVRCLKD